MPDSKQNEECRSDAIKCDCFQVDPQPLDVNSCLSAFTLLPPPRQSPPSSSPTQTLLLSRAPSSPAPLFALSSTHPPESPSPAPHAFHTPRAAPAPASSTQSHN